MIVTMFVAGTPIPQGSTRGWVTKGGRVAITHSNPRTMNWRHAIADVTISRMEALYGRGYSLWDRPVKVQMAFAMNRPKSRPKRLAHPTTRPDLDKLVRAVLDGLTGTILKDDNCVVEIDARKSYGEPTGAWITVEGLDA